MAWPSDLGTSFGGPRGTLGVAAEGRHHPARGTWGGRNQFSNVARPASRHPLPDSAHFTATLGAGGSIAAGDPSKTTWALDSRENSGEAFTGRPDPDRAPCPPHGGAPMELTTGRPARHPPGHPGARSRLCGSQEIGNCEPRTSPGCRNVSGWAPRGRLARSRLFHSGGFRHVLRERRRPRVTALTPGEVSGPPLEVSHGRNQGPLHPPWPLPVSPGPLGSRQHCLPHPGRHLRTPHERPEPQCLYLETGTVTANFC